jgi:outer membrane lipoprotein-sorting protein
MLIAPDGEVKELKVLGRDQSLLAYSFSQERLNPPLNDSIFHFEIPPGAEVVDAIEFRSEQ